VWELDLPRLRQVLEQLLPAACHPSPIIPTAATSSFSTAILQTSIEWSAQSKANRGLILEIKDAIYMAPVKAWTSR
jgi:hypothetical protein